jgi:predicted nuclease of predicted toxin-antitoxin system
MAEKIKCHLDESVERAIADSLRRREIDVTATPEVELMGVSDEEHLAFALGQGRVVFTHDADFLRLHRRGVEHAGIVYCHQQSRSIGEIVRALVRIWELQTSESMYQHVEFI